jgi:uncharacterized protein
MSPTQPGRAPAADARLKIAIIGSGIAGNAAAHRLHRDHDVTLFEADSRPGGHADTHLVELDGEVHAVDTGFIVFNDWTYPNFIALLDELGVASQPSEMSFSVCHPAAGLEYSGSSLDGLFAQRRNLLRPAFLGMIAQILRFNRRAPALLQSADDPTLGEYLARERYDTAFTRHYLVPMGAAIWSTDPSRMMDFPARTFVRFFHNHGLLSVNRRPVWRVIRGGSARYVEKLTAPLRDRLRLGTRVESVRRLPDRVMVQCAGAAAERFDYAFVGCHADQALGLLSDASQQEREVLGAIGYQRNEAVLHTDTALLPRRRRAWAAWNYHVLSGSDSPVALTYNMNILQGIESRHTFCVTLNQTDRIRPDRILRRLVYHHPVFSAAAVRAQQRQGEINGVRRTFYCGAYWGYGFHEDGVVSALKAVEHFSGSSDAQRDLSRVA